MEDTSRDIASTGLKSSYEIKIIVKNDFAPYWIARKLIFSSCAMRQIEFLRFTPGNSGLNHILILKSLDFSIFCFTMVNMERIQQSFIIRDLAKKMVLLVGPRQTGKTWLAKNIAKTFNNSVYLNYDQLKDREIIHSQSWLSNINLLILDELQKMPDWKNYLKGVYDTKPEQLRILVTGSARLEIFEQLGDSLAGRYFKHRLLPISAAELAKTKQPIDLEKLLLRGGFPEPYLETEEINAARWRQQYVNSLLSTDVFEFDKIHNLKALHLLFQLLQHRVGSPISYQSLAEDIAISPVTVKKYIQVLEALFVIFTVTPYAKNIARSLLKEPKVYFYDTGLVNGDNGAKFENLVAVSLLKHVYGKNDYLAENCELHYLRTKDGVEVDFVITKDHDVEQMIEAKFTDNKPSKHLQRMHEKYAYPAVQVVYNLRNQYRVGDIEILRAENFLPDLYI